MRRYLLVITFYSIIFFSSRVGYYYFSPIVELFSDSFQYNDLAFQINQGIWPNFGNLMPVYPLFLYSVKLLSYDIIIIPIAQACVAYFSGLMLIFSVLRLNFLASIIVAFLLACFQGSNIYLTHETSVLTESLYTSFLILICAFLLEYKNSQKSIYLAFLSTIAALCFLLRLNGLSIAILILIMAIWALYKKDFKAFKMVIAPFAIIITLFFIYNKAQTGSLLPFRYKIYYVKNYYTSPEFYQDLKSISPSYMDNISEASFVEAQKKGVLVTLGQESQSVKSKLLDYLFWHDSKSFYSDELKKRIKYYSDTPYIDLDKPIFINIGNAPVELLEYSYMNYWNQKPRIKNLHIDKDGYGFIKYPFFINSLEFIEGLYKIFFNKKIFIFFYFLFPFLLLLKFIRRHFCVYDLYIYIVLTSIFILESLIISIGAFRMIPRYIYPTEFIVFLSPILFLTCILRKFSIKLPRLL